MGLYASSLEAFEGIDEACRDSHYRRRVVLESRSGLLIETWAGDPADEENVGGWEKKQRVYVPSTHREPHRERMIRLVAGLKVADLDMKGEGMLIDKLRAEGKTVRVRHQRYIPVQPDQLVTAQGNPELLEGPYSYKEIEEKGVEPYPKGGTTEVIVYDGDYREGAPEIARGTSRCNPKLDAFSRSLGVEIALGRAMMPEAEKIRRKEVPVKQRILMTQYAQARQPTL